MEASLRSSDSGEAATACVIQSLSIHFEPEPATCTHMLQCVCALEASRDKSLRQTSIFDHRK